jgi:arginyl-tRNA synthetase
MAALLSHPQGVFESPMPLAPTLVEFVSANPTGPLHLGHARQAVLGDVIAKLLARLGGKVGTEFFYNDAGAQIDRLVNSVQLRIQEAQGATLVFERDGGSAATLKAGEVLFPIDGYHGTYIQELAQAWLAQGGNLLNVPGVRSFAIDTLSAEQQADLDFLGVHFDGRVSERALYDSGQVQSVIDGLLPHAYFAQQAKQENNDLDPNTASAWFLETTKWNDDKDRVMIKADGSTTYFVPDVAYHLDKWKRGWKRAINIQGADHHGTLARVQAGVQFLDPSIGNDYPHTIFHTMIKVVKDGQPVKASKRAGDYLTAREIAEAVGMDAFRLAMLDKKPDSPMTLDIDQWLTQNASNPVYGIQYAHARLCGALAKVDAAPAGDVDPGQWMPCERSLLMQLALWNDRLNGAAQDFDPVRAATITRELASSVHECYQKGPKLLSLAPQVQASRIQLFQAAIDTLKNAGSVLGVHCPDRMSREDELTDDTPAIGRPAMR